MLAARTNGLRNVFRRSCGKHKYHMCRRLFQRLQQRVEGRVRNLVRFVENVNLEPVARGTISCSLAQFANFVDAAVGSGVDFNHVNRIADANLGTRLANPARFRNRLVGRTAVERHRQDSGHRRLSNSAVPAEDVSMRGASLVNGILQRAGDVLLPNDFRKFLWTVFAREDLVAHGRRYSDYTSPHNCGSSGCNLRKIRIFWISLPNPERPGSDGATSTTACAMTPATANIPATFTV